MRTHFIGLPQAGNLGQHQFFEARHILLGHGNAIKRGEKLANAPALEHYRAARHLSGMRGEDRDAEHTIEPVHGFIRTDAHTAHLEQGAGERTALTAGRAAQLQGDAAALAVVGFSQIDEFEVEGKGAGEQDGALDGQRMDQFKRLGAVAGGLFLLAAGLGIATADGALAQRLDMRKEILAGLLAQHLAKQRAKRAHVAPQGRLLQVAGTGFQLLQPLRPALWIPQKGHRDLIMHDGKRVDRFASAAGQSFYCCRSTFL